MCWGTLASGVAGGIVSRVAGAVLQHGRWTYALLHWHPGSIFDTVGVVWEPRHEGVASTLLHLTHAHHELFDHTMAMEKGRHKGTETAERERRRTTRVFRKLRDARWSAADERKRCTARWPGFVSVSVRFHRRRH